MDTFIKLLLQGYAFSPTERVLFSLPAKYGGIELIIPSEIRPEEYENSREITKESTSKVKCNKTQFQDKNKKLHQKPKEKAKRRKTAKSNKKTSCKSKLRSIEASAENRASIWLTVIRKKRNGFFLNKKAFWDAIRIRYNIPLER